MHGKAKKIAFSVEVSLREKLWLIKTDLTESVLPYDGVVAIVRKFDRAPPG